MGQAASYAESSVQRALLRYKQEEQLEEEELLRFCGFSKPQTCSNSNDHNSDNHQDKDSNSAASNRKSGERSPSAAPPLPDDAQSSLPDKVLPPAPDSFGPFVSLAPEYYTLDELRDALRYLPDTLWVSLYRVSLLYSLDNDHDGRIKATDISFFLDWGIRTVGRDVPPEQLAEVLQTHAALHCWHRCLHVGEALEAEKAALAAQQQAGGGAAAGSAAAARNRRRPMQGGVGGHNGPLSNSHGAAGGGGGGGGGGAASSYAQYHQPPQSVAPFMLLHLREAFFNRRPGAPAPLPSNFTASSSTTANSLGQSKGLVDSTQSSPPAAQFFSPRSAVTPAITATARLEGAAHFAGWLLRLVMHQERDRRHERQRLERRLRLMTAADSRQGGGSGWVRHSQLLQHRSARLRAGSMGLFSSLAEPVDSEDVVMSHSGLRGQFLGAVRCDSEPDVVALAAPRLSLPDSDTVVGLAAHSTASSNTQTAAGSPGGGRGLKDEDEDRNGGTPQRSHPSSCSISPLDTMAAQQGTAAAGEQDGAAPQLTTRFAPTASAIGSAAAPPTPPAATPEQQQQQQQSMSERANGPALTVSVSSSSRAMPAFATQTAAAQPEGNPMRDSVRGGDGERRDGSPSWWNTCGYGGVGGGGGNAGPGGGAAMVSEQLSAMLMDSEAFYLELEKNGWCTVGAVEEAYLDCAVEDSYCLSFWAFCRLLNESSADEVQAALEMTTAQATAVLTSANAVEEYRRAAALRQLQRCASSGTFPRTFSSSGGWERQLQVVPMFIVSEYTFVAFVTAFIHAYWDMLESMGLDAATQPLESAAAATGQSTSMGMRLL